MSFSWIALIPWVIGAILFVRLWRAAARLGDSALTAGAEKEPAGVEGWACDPSFYADGVYCDCHCGNADPDCADDQC